MKQGLFYSKEPPAKREVLLFNKISFYAKTLPTLNPRKLLRYLFFTLNFLSQASVKLFKITLATSLYINFAVLRMIILQYSTINSIIL